MQCKLLVLGVFLPLLSTLTAVRAAPEPWNVSGPEECAECHRAEYSIWEETPHSLTYESMPDSDEGVEIGEKLELDDVVEAKLCQTCHLTLQSEGEDEPADVIAGVSCDSCHGASINWIEPHAKENKTPEEEKTLWAESEKAGLLRPGDVYAFAKNCLGCHLVPQENLVNTGGHAAGSDFNLVTWSQGIIRHNTFYSAENNETSKERKRLMAVIGVAVELQLGLTAFASVKDAGGKYARALLERLQNARAALAEMAGQADAPGVKAIYTAIAGLEIRASMDSAEALQAATAIATRAAALSANGADLSALDALIESYGNFRGEPQT